MLRLSYTPLVFMSQRPLRGFTCTAICGTNIVPGARLLLSLSPLLPQSRAPVPSLTRYQRERHAQPLFKQALHCLTSLHRPSRRIRFPVVAPYRPCNYRPHPLRQLVRGMILWYRTGKLFALLGPKLPHHESRFPHRLGPSQARSVNRRGTPTVTEGAYPLGIGRDKRPRDRTAEVRGARGSHARRGVRDG